MKSPLVTVIIPAYNAESTINSAVQSVLIQSYQNLEILIIDDGSNDGTCMVVKQIAKETDLVRLLKVNHGGVSRARNAGITEARGDYCMFLDADDELPPKAVEHLIYAINIDPFTAISIGGMDFVRFDGEDIVSRKSYSVEKDELIIPVDYANQLKELLHCNYLQSSCAKLYHVVFLRSNNLKFDESLDSFEDFEFIIRCISAAPILYITPAIVYRYSLRATQSNSRKTKDNIVDQMLSVKQSIDSFCITMNVEPSTFNELSSHLFVNAINNIYASNRIDVDKWDMVLYLRDSPEYTPLFISDISYPNLYTRIIFFAVKYKLRIPFTFAVTARNYIRKHTGQPA